MLSNKVEGFGEFCVLLLFFFRSICNIQEELFIQRVVFLFIQSEIANSFFSKLNDSSRVRTTAFSGSRFGVRISVMPNIFYNLSSTFLIPEISETLKGSFTKFFSTVRQKNFDGKLWYLLLCIKFFDTPICLKHWRDVHEIFRHRETQKFRLKIVICPLLSINFFSIPEIFWKTERFPYKAFRFGPVRQKISTKPWCPFSYTWKFSIKEFFWHTKVFSNEIFRYSETRTFRRKIVIPPPPLWSIKFFPHQKFSETQNGSFTKFFRSCEMKKNFGKTVKLPEFFRST